MLGCRGTASCVKPMLPLVDRAPVLWALIWLLAVAGGDANSRLRSGWIDPATAAGTPVLSTRSCGTFAVSWAVNAGRNGTELNTRVCAASRINGNCYNNGDVPAVRSGSVDRSMHVPHCMPLSSGVSRASGP